MIECWPVFTSLWMIPASWAQWRAAPPISCNMSAARDGVSPPRRDHGGERLARDELHDQEGRPVLGHSQVVDEDTRRGAKAGPSPRASWRKRASPLTVTLVPADDLEGRRCA